MKTYAIIFLTAFLAAFIPQKSEIEPLYYIDVTDERLPVSALEGLSMDARFADANGDGRPDIIIANEFRPNILLINNGKGFFTDESDARLPRSSHDSEDIAAYDFDGDGDIDILIVSEDDQKNEFYINDGKGFFSDASDRIPVGGTTNGVNMFDVNGNGHMDVILANNGQNVILVNDGKGFWKDETAERLPAIEDVSQDIRIGDVNGDGFPDLVVANEGANRILINNGKGVFTDESERRLPYRPEPEETRQAALADVDGDGHLDIYFANIQGFVEGALRQNRLLLNDGKGFFTDVTATHIPADDDRSFDGTFYDVDGDGHVDIITSNTNGARFGGLTPFRVYKNDGKGKFTDATSSLFPESLQGRGFAVAIADVDGDGINDMFFASRGSVDRLLLGKKKE